jgi:hypothetical protein
MNSESLGLKPLKAWFDENGKRHWKFDREELIKFVQAHSDETLVSVLDEESGQASFIPAHALSIYLQS